MQKTPMQEKVIANAMLGCMLGRVVGWEAVYGGFHSGEVHRLRRRTTRSASRIYELLVIANEPLKRPNSE